MGYTEVREGFEKQNKAKQMDGLFTTDTLRSSSSGPLSEKHVSVPTHVDPLAYLVKKVWVVVSTLPA